MVSVSIPLSCNFTHAPTLLECVVNLAKLSLQVIPCTFFAATWNKEQICLSLVYSTFVLSLKTETGFPFAIDKRLALLRILIAALTKQYFECSLSLRYWMTYPLSKFLW